MTTDDARFLFDKLKAKAAPAENGCLEWKGATDEDGYGLIWWMGKKQRAHRVSWSIFNGEIPEDMVMGHRCDNPPCIEPGHLFVTTQQGNLDDMAGKGRSTASVDEETVRRIRRAKRAGMTEAATAKLFGVSRSLVKDIWTGKTRRNVE